MTNFDTYQYYIEKQKILQNFINKPKSGKDYLNFLKELKGNSYYK